MTLVPYGEIVRRLARLEASRSTLLYHMKQAVSLLASGDIAQATIILRAAIAVADDEDRVS